jgi:hypothetical protein
MVILTRPIRHPPYRAHYSTKSIHPMVILFLKPSINFGLAYFPPIRHPSTGFVYHLCSHYASASAQCTCHHTCRISCSNNIMFFLTYHKTQLNTMFFKTLPNHQFIIISHPTTYTISQSTIHNYITINSS